MAPNDLQLTKKGLAAVSAAGCLIPQSPRPTWSTPRVNLLISLIPTDHIFCTISCFTSGGGGASSICRPAHIQQTRMALGHFLAVWPKLPPGL